MMFDSNTDITAGPSLSFHCIAPDNTETIEKIDMPALTAAQSARQADALKPLPGAVTRPPLTGDPQAPTQVQLVAMGYPHRPDARLSPAAYSKWLKHVSQPAVGVAPGLVQHPNSFASITNTTTTAWAGAGLLQPSTTYVEARANGYVPMVYAPPVVDSTHAFFWVGVDGWNGGSIIQCGTDGAAVTYLHFGHYYSYTSYYAWLEYFPASYSTVSSFSIAPNDELFIDAWSGDYYGSETATGDYGWFYIYDVRTSSYVYQKIAKPSGATFLGGSAEFIMEAPVFNGTRSHMSQFDGTSMWDASAVASSCWNCFTHDWGTDAALVASTVNPATGNMIVSSSVYINYLTFEFDNSW
jgi:hypothetical protein